jgi:hypothetical protein
MTCVTNTSDNTAIGPYSYSTGTGNSNTAIGKHSMCGVGGGGENTAIGAYSMLSNTASENTAVGSQALRNNTSGEKNTAVGRAALYSNGSGSSNTALGTNALLSSSSSCNTGIGAESLLYIGGGNGNNAMVGAQAGQFETGDYNTGVGSQSLKKASTSSSTGNTAVGYNTFSSLTTGTYNTSLGHNINPLSTQSYNTFVGSTITGSYGDSNTVIGARISGLISGGSNQIAIADGAGSVRIYGDSSGRVTIGPTGANPLNSKLHVTGNVTAAGQGVAQFNNIGSLGTPTLQVDWNSGNVQAVNLTGTYSSTTFSNGITGGVYSLIMNYTGSTTISWGAQFRAAGGATGGAITGTTGATDIASFIVGATGYFLAINKDFKQL